MSTSRLVRRIIWVVGIGLILCLNIFGAVPTRYKAKFGRVGPDVASILDGPGEQDDMLIPVQTRATNDLVRLDTGQRVRVYVRNTYKDDEVMFYPRWTLIIAGTTAGLHLLSGLLFRGQPR